MSSGILAPPQIYRCGHPAGHPKLLLLETPLPTLFLSECRMDGDTYTLDTERKGDASIINHETSIRTEYISRKPDIANRSCVRGRSGRSGLVVVHNSHVQTDRQPGNTLSEERHNKKWSLVVNRPNACYIIGFLYCKAYYAYRPKRKKLIKSDYTSM